jgi:formate dehydrogenase iron-sulfur subunit
MTFEKRKDRILTLRTGFALILMLAGAAALTMRFMHGLGETTNLSDTWPWGLWIAFDLVWIAIAAGAFTAAAIVYIIDREKYHGVARSAVTMGLLSYSFVVVTLVADLGLPWHVWQLLVQRPHHSAMFEVSWCIGLYASILTLEFLPVILERFKMTGLAHLVHRFAPIYVVFALSFFVYLMSGSVSATVWAAVVFAALAWMLGAPSQAGGAPVMLVIAAVTFSTMHQSSLGSLFLLMPDKLNHLWWSPMLPVYFFLSSVACGLAAVILLETYIPVLFKRPKSPHLASAGGLATYAWIALVAYFIVRLADLGIRGQMGNVFTTNAGYLFLAEAIIGGLLPLIILGGSLFKKAPKMVNLGAMLIVAGVIFNRMNVVIFGMNVTGTAPSTTPAPYFPTVIEILVTLGVIASTIFLFSVSTKTFPVLPKYDKTTTGTWKL